MAKGPKVNPSTMLWFIRSRSYMPLHEIRRRFMIESDDSSVVYDDDGPVFVGLPPKPAAVVMELSKQGKIGLECSAEHRTRIVIGVFPMHPAREDSLPRLLAPRPFRPEPMVMGDVAMFDLGASDAEPADQSDVGAPPEPTLQPPAARVYGAARPPGPRRSRPHGSRGPMTGSPPLVGRAPNGAPPPIPIRPADRDDIAARRPMPSQPPPPAPRRPPPQPRPIGDHGLAAGDGSG